MRLFFEALTYYRGSDEPLSVIVILLVRVTLVLATGWLASRALARSSAAVQHRVWLLAVWGTLVVPLLWALTPRWRLPLVALYVQGSPQPVATPPTAEAVWPNALVILWIAGAVAGLAYTVLGIVLARRLFAASRPCRDSVWQTTLDAVRRDLGVTRRIELRVAPCPMSPAVWSVRRVRILVPEQSSGWPLELRRSVLLHELAHVARRDWASQIITSLACAVWWFHPLVWYAAGRVRALAEQAADDCVIRSGSRRSDYAQGLLAIAAALGWARAPAAVQAIFHPSHLEQRLRAILDPTRQRNPLGGQVSAATIVIAAALMVLLATVTPSVVRAVPHLPSPGKGPAKDPAPQNQGPATAVDPNVTLAGSYVRPIDPRLPNQPNIAVPPEPPTVQLIPNWDTSKSAEMLIPNFQRGMSETVLVKPVLLSGKQVPKAVLDEQLRVIHMATEKAAAQGAVAAQPVAAPANSAAPTAMPAQAPLAAEAPLGERRR